jgi:uncharacterized protein (DUF1778 family)
MMITATACKTEISVGVHPLTLAVIGLGAQVGRMDVASFIVLAAYRYAQEQIAEFESIEGARPC